MLNEIRYEVAARVVTVLRRDDADGHRLVELEGIAHGDDPLGDPQLARISPRQCRAALDVQLQHRQVGDRIDPDHLRRQLPIVGQRHLDIGARAADHVTVRHDVTVIRDEHAGAQTRLRSNRIAAVEHLKERVADDDILRGRDIDGRLNRPLCHCRQVRQSGGERGGGIGRRACLGDVDACSRQRHHRR